MLGGGTLTLGGDNTYSGATVVGAGSTLEAGTGSVIPSTTVVTFGAEATFNLMNVGGVSLAGLSGTDPTSCVAMGCGTLTIAPTVNQTYAGAFSGYGSSSVTIAGTAAQTLSGNNGGFAGSSSSAPTPRLKRPPPPPSAGRPASPASP